MGEEVFFREKFKVRQGDFAADVFTGGDVYAGKLIPADYLASGMGL